MNKIKLVAICGKAGAGKDTFLHYLMKESGGRYHEIVSCTTRPPRENEVEGVNYHFLTNDDFARKVLSGDMLEATIFNDWCYGTAYSNLDPDKINIGVFNPSGINILLEDDRIDLLIFYIVASDKQRLLRQLNREEHPDVNEIIRRFQADEKDFLDVDYHKAIKQILGKLDLPIIYDADIGHVKPMVSLVTGSITTFKYKEGKCEIITELR